ncbi:protein transporter Sec31 [Kitasatospora griseola]|uniref:protein transporter Sec31 n=1 Tax=Kitasatospora griseola TaxID=2064 RepID=UPI003658E37A
MASTNSTYRRTRTVTHQRQVPHTINGLTKLVTENYTVDEPVPPRDWDLAVRNAVTAATALTVAGSIAWSTDSIGSLLGRTVNPAIAYTAAAVFDLAWITCMALEWLARYDRRKASLPRKLGYVALIIAMLAVATNGWLAGGKGAFVVGLIGAFVSAIAKGMWTMAMRAFGSTLDDRSQQWVEARFSDVQARLATAAATRELARVEGTIAGYEDTFGTPAVLPQTEEEPASVLAAADGTVRAAIAIARHTLGADASPAQIAAQLVLAKVLPDTETAVRVVAEEMVRDGAHHGAPQVTGMSKASAITTIADWCGDGAPSDIVVRVLAHQAVEVTDSQVRNEISRAASRARKKAPAKVDTFGFGKP